jgi:hypothetical protein
MTLHADSCVAGATNIVFTYNVSAVAGATGATQTFSIRVNIARTSGASTNHQAVIRADVLNAVAGGVTIS